MKRTQFWGDENFGEVKILGKLKVWEGQNCGKVKTWGIQNFKEGGGPKFEEVKLSRRSNIWAVLGQNVDIPEMFTSPNVLTLQIFYFSECLTS